MNPIQQGAYRAATNNGKSMAGIEYGRNLKCSVCKQYRSVKTGCKRKPHYICADCAKGGSDENGNA